MKLFVFHLGQKCSIPVQFCPIINFVDFLQKKNISIFYEVAMELLGISPLPFEPVVKWYGSVRQIPNIVSGPIPEWLDACLRNVSAAGTGPKTSGIKAEHYPPLG